MSCYKCGEDVPSDSDSVYRIRHGGIAYACCKVECAILLLARNTSKLQIMDVEASEAEEEEETADVEQVKADEYRETTVTYPNGRMTRIVGLFRNGVFIEQKEEYIDEQQSVTVEEPPVEECSSSKHKRPRRSIRTATTSIQNLSLPTSQN